MLGSIRGGGGADTQDYSSCLLAPHEPPSEGFALMLFRYFAKYTNCTPTSTRNNYVVAKYTNLHFFLSREKCLGAYLPSPNSSTVRFTKSHLRCFSSSTFLSPKSRQTSHGTAASSPAPPAAWLHDTKLPTNLALSEFPFFKMEIIIPPYLGGLVNVYTAL